MIKEIKNYNISVSDASKGGIHNLPLVDIKTIVGFDTDKYFKHIGQNKIRASIDLILFTRKRKYFVEFKGGDYDNIEDDNINDKITFTMLKYFGDGDEKILDSRNNNYFYLVIKGIDELSLGINANAMQNNPEITSNVNLDKIDKTIKKFENFCYKKSEIIAAGRFLVEIKKIDEDERFIVNF